MPHNDASQLAALVAELRRTIADREATIATLRATNGTLRRELTDARKLAEEASENVWTAITADGRVIAADVPYYTAFNKARNHYWKTREPTFSMDHSGKVAFDWRKHGGVRLPNAA